MSRRLRILATSFAIAAGAVACSDDAPEPIVHLVPGPNPILTDDPLWSPQPHRERPRALCVSQERDRGWVMLAGTVDDPGQHVAVVDLTARKVLRRVRVGYSPWGCALDPSGRFLVVTLRYSDHAVVLDTRSDRQVAQVRVPFYTEQALFHPTAGRVYLTNRWKDAVLTWDVAIGGGGFRVLRTSYEGREAWEAMGTPVGDNPDDLALSEDGKRLFVGTVQAGAIAVVDADTLAPIDVDGDATTRTHGAPPGISWINNVSPVGALAVHGPWLFVADIGKGTGNLPDRGLDSNDDGSPGDGTANVVFQDLQNEIAVVDTRTLKEVHRYTSDSICCHDYRDVDPDRPDRGLLIPPPETWAPEVLPWLPPKETWIVAGALPEAFAVRDGVLWVAYAGSSEVQGFRIDDADGSLEALQGTGELLRTGFNPMDIKPVADGLVTVDRLAEGLTFLDPETGPTGALVVGDLSGGDFPATDAELGEALNEMTAPMTIDGDQTCVHCHRDNGATARVVVMPLLANRVWGTRATMAQRGLYDTRPWFVESSMDEENFFPVLNEFDRKENFCCERLDPTVWGLYPTILACLADEGLDGCQHVLNCETDPPPECAERPYAFTPFLRRADFVRDAAMKYLGRDTTFGDVLFREDLAGNREPIPLDFEGITRAIGLFMLREPRLLPSPWASLDLPSASRGRTLYEDPAVGCNLCHPVPNTTTASLPEPFSPSGQPVRFPPVISQARTPDGNNASLVNPGFMATFPETTQTPAGLHLGATPLRGLWDRPSTRFYHDGRARSLLEALVPPGHPGLEPGQSGHNERDGVFDTHGGTSQLDRYQIRDLMNFLVTL